MGFTVYDCREDIRNILVTANIRARFCKLEAGSGSLDQWHTHDLGDEIFIILAGRVEFKINGEVKELGPGQMCYARFDEPHSVRVISEDPVYMYLSVTPHIQPTHTMYDDNDERLPLHFRPSSDYDTQTDSTTPVEQLVDQHIGAAQELVEVAQRSAQIQEERGAALKKALEGGDLAEASRLRAAMWAPLLELFKKTRELADGWNTLAPRAGEVNATY
jgi:mannose-6-phosphate isomerase-like protein (cupin superfamily)